MRIFSSLLRRYAVGRFARGSIGINVFTSINGLVKNSKRVYVFPINNWLSNKVQYLSFHEFSEIIDIDSCTRQYPSCQQSFPASSTPHQRPPPLSTHRIRHPRNSRGRRSIPSLCAQWQRLRRASVCPHERDSRSQSPK